MTGKSGLEKKNFPGMAPLSEYFEE